MAGADLRIGFEASWAQTVEICSVTLPKNVAWRSPLPVSDSRIMWTYVSGFVVVARSATDWRPSRSKSSPRPCQITRGSWIVLSVLGNAAVMTPVASEAMIGMSRSMVA